MGSRSGPWKRGLVLAALALLLGLLPPVQAAYHHAVLRLMNGDA